MTKYWKTAHGAAALLLTILYSSNLFAQGAIPCAPRDKVTRQLELQYGESQVGVGLVGTGDTPNLMERWENKDGSTWTLLVIDASKGDLMACILSSGIGWQKVKWSPGEQEG